MNSGLPRYCQPDAFRTFAAATQQLDRTDSLVHAAVAISRHLMQDASFAQVESELASWSEIIRDRVPSGSRQGLLANMHELLFQELQFRGNAEDYYNTRNSCLPSVLRSRRGIPITLTLVYKSVAEQIGLEVNGLNCPGHFLAHTIVDQDEMIVDTFRGGKILTVDEARVYIEQVIHQPVSKSQILTFASNASWVARILRNLQNLFSMQGNSNDLQAMQELETLLPTQ